jgi:DNA mismatch endonuclease (patch repair protein)
MSRTAQKDNVRERSLRSELHARGLRFRLHQSVLKGLRRTVDIAFPASRTAVFMDGCFWHSCPEHRTWPKSNAAWWRQKIEANVARDRDTDARLQADGWLVLRVWEHEPLSMAADRIESAVNARRPHTSKR